MTIQAAYEDLAAAVVAQAVKDWRQLVRKRADNLQFGALRRFFTSPWCGELCGGVDQRVILKRLEDERQEVIYKKIRRRTAYE